MSLKNFLPFWLLCTFTPSSWAEITLDGSFGRSGALSGTDYAITADLGKSMGGNLFHSFRDFNLSQNESATFSGPSTINNIISRVTGGKPSQIHGLLRSTIPDADVYLLNPAGILFGEGAKLDLQGSFHASTADTLRLGSDGEFNARNVEQSILTVMAPSAFGFLKDKPATITLQNSKLAVLTGKNLSLIGGDLNLNSITNEKEIFSTELSVESGRLNLVSQSLPSEVMLTKSGLDISPKTSRGIITANRTQMKVNEGGQIFIRSGQLNLATSYVKSETTGDKKGGTINIRVEQLGLQEASTIFTKTSGAEEGGNIFIKVADALHILGFPSGIYTNNEIGFGNTGNIEIEAGQIMLTQGGQITSITNGSGKSGDIIIKVADELNIGGSFEYNGKPYMSGIYNQSFSQDEQAKPVGNIEITAREVVLSDLGQIANSSSGPAKGGSIVIKADNLTLLGTNGNYGDYETVIINASTSEEVNAGPSGDIEIEARQVTLKDGAAIRNITLGTQATGTITMVVSDLLTVQSGFIGAPRRESGGKSGDIKIEAGQLTLSSGGQINSTTVNSTEVSSIVIKVADTLSIFGVNEVEPGFVIPSGIFTDSTDPEGTGNAGNIKIVADQIILTSGAEISSSIAGSGKAGNIEITAHQMKLDDSAEIFSDTKRQGEAGTIIIKVAELTLDDSKISTQASNFPGVNEGDAGKIDITAKQVILTNYSSITSSNDGPGTGKGGTIILNTNTLTIIHSSEIITQSFRAGDAGKIDITTRQLTLTQQGKIDSSTYGFGDGGTITLKVSDTLTVSGDASFWVSRISSRSIFDNENAGNAGLILIEAKKIRLVAGGEITTFAINASGGDINITVPTSLYLHEGNIRTDVTNGQGDGGEIEIAKPELVVLNNSRILTNADQGWGGGIDITADKFILSSDSLLDASSRVAGRSGEIKIEADSYVDNGFITLPKNFSNPPSLPRCETQFTTQETPSHFTRANRAKMRRDELKEGVWGSPLDF